MNFMTRIFSILMLIAAAAALAAAAVERNAIYLNSVKVWESIAKSSPTKRRPHQNYGQALSTAGQLKEALDQFKIVLSLEDDGSVPMRDVYREIGVVYFRLGLFDEAIIAWQNALKHAPFDSGVLNNLAIAFLKQKRIDEAASHAETASRTNPNMPEPWNTLGEIYLSKGDPRKAASYFKQYLHLRPEDSRGYWNAALALREAGQYEEAIQYAVQFLAREPDPRYRVSAEQLVEQLKNQHSRFRR